MHFHFEYCFQVLFFLGFLVLPRAWCESLRLRTQYCTREYKCCWNPCVDEELLVYSVTFIQVLKTYSVDEKCELIRQFHQMLLCRKFIHTIDCLNHPEICCPFKRRLKIHPKPKEFGKCKDRGLSTWLRYSGELFFRRHSRVRIWLWIWSRDQFHRAFPVTDTEES